MTTTMTSVTIAAVLSLGLAASALAAEDITEHETYEKRTMKIETVPAATPTTTVAPSRVYQHHDESESTTIEKHTNVPAAPPPAVVKHRTTDSVDIQEKN